MANEFVQTMADARVDAQSLSDFVFKPSGFKVARRLAPTIDTLQFYIDRFDATKATTDAYVVTIPTIVNDAINNTAVEGGILADTFLTVTPNGQGTIARTQRDKNADTLTPFDFGAVGDGTHHPLSERYTTLAEAQAVYPHATALTDSIDWCALTSFFNYTTANLVKDANWSGDFSINKSVNTVASVHATQRLSGVLRLTATAEMPYMIRTAGVVRRYGDMFLTGGNLAWYGHYNGDNINGDSTSSISSSFGSVYIDRCTMGGNFNGDLTMFNSYTNLRVANCGSRRILASDFNFIAHGSNADVSQYSTLSVTNLPRNLKPHPSSAPLPASFVIIENEPYQVIAIDAVASTIDIRPRYYGSATTLSHAFGAAYHSAGSNGSMISVEQASFISCGVGTSIANLYGGSFGSLTIEGCGVGLVKGYSRSDACGNVVVKKGYFEINTVDYVEIATAGEFKGLLAPSNTNIDPNKVFSLGSYAYKKSDGTTFKPELLNAEVDINGKTYNTLDELQGVVDITSNNIYTRRLVNSGNINISINTRIAELFRKNFIVLSVLGTGANGNPTGNITLVPPVGYTLNNQSSIVLPAQTTGAYTVTLLWYAGKNIVVSVSRPTANHLSKVVAYNAPAIPPATQVSTTVPLVGAKIGDMGTCSFGSPLQGVRMWCEVTAADVVTVYFHNSTAASVDLPNGSLWVKVVSPTS